MKCFRRLKIIREANKMTQQQVADALGICRSAYCSYEIGRRSPDVDTINILARFYRIPVESFFEKLEMETVNEEATFEGKEDMRYVSQLSKKEVALIAKYRTMSETDREDVHALVDSKVESKL